MTEPAHADRPRNAARARARGLYSVAALALIVAAVLAFLHFRASNLEPSTQPPLPAPPATSSPHPPALFTGPRAPQASAARVSRASPAPAQTERVELTSLGLAMDAPSGFEPRVSGSGVILSPPGPLRLQATLIAVHPAGIVEDPSVYSEATQLANGATLKYRAVTRPEAQPPATELQGLMEAFGASYFVSCRGSAYASYVKSHLAQLANVP